MQDVAEIAQQVAIESPVRDRNATTADSQGCLRTARRKRLSEFRRQCGRLAGMALRTEKDWDKIAQAVLGLVRGVYP